MTYRLFSLRLLTILGLLFNSAHAYWDRSLSEEDIKALQQRKYVALKTWVLQYLIDSWCSQQKATLLMDLILLEKPNVCVEIGVFTGSSLIPVASVLKYLKNGIVYAIDPWSNQEAIKNLVDDGLNYKWWGELDFWSIYNQFSIAMTYWGIERQCLIIPEPSRSAITRVVTIDFLHIDGNYSMQGALEDVELYLPKVKKGGYILFSNLHWLIANSTPRIHAFQRLLDSCIIVEVIDNYNAILVKKIFD